MSLFKKLFGYYRNSFVAAAIAVWLALLVLAVIGFTTTEDLDIGRFYINLFKFFIGTYCLAISFYLYYGPTLNSADILTRVTPASQVPIESVLLYFTLGLGIVFNSLTIVHPGPVLALFFTIIGHTIFLAVATAYFVLIVDRARWVR